MKFKDANGVLIIAGLLDPSNVTPGVGITMMGLLSAYPAVSLIITVELFNKDPMFICHAKLVSTSSKKWVADEGPVTVVTENTGNGDVDVF